MTDRPKLTPNAIVDEILRLPPEERMEILERVWESIGPDAAPVPQWHIDELEHDFLDPSPLSKESFADFMARLLRDRKR